MTRPTPNCHLTIGPESLYVRRVDSDGYRDVAAEATKPRPCTGSACSAWETLGTWNDQQIGRCGLVQPTVPWMDPATGGDK